MIQASQVKRVTVVNGKTFGLGHIPNPGHRFTSLRIALARVGRATPPASLDLRPFLPKVYDQGQTGSCEGHAGSAGIAGACAKLGRPLSFVPSMGGLYTLARALDRAPNADGSLTALGDVGAEGNQIIRSMQEYGIRPMGPMASDGRFSDCDPSTINDEPILGEMESDAVWRMMGAYSILDQTANDVGDAYMQALNAFGPLPTASFVDSAFMNWTPAEGPIGLPDTTDPNGGGHKILCVGYDQQGPGGTRRWIIRNSWSETWGDAGYFYASDEWLAQTDEREVYDVTRLAS